VTGSPAANPFQESTVAGLLSNLLVGNPAAARLARALTRGVPLPVLRLNQNAGDQMISNCGEGSIPVNCFYATGNPANTGTDAIQFPTLNMLLTVEQQALLGCGPVYLTNCEIEGVDLLNAEMSALVQSWPGFPGAGGDWNTADPVPQPGTVGFVGGAVCTRFEGGSFVLPGCRGPGDPGYDPARDGDPAGLLQPFTGQPFRTELGAVSWNLLATLVGLSAPPGTEPPAIDEFDASDPLREGACSFVQPQFCSTVQALYAVAHTTRPTLRAGGNGRYGRVDFDWHVAGSGVLRYEKRNVLGFSMDVAEDVTKSNWGFEGTWIEDVPFDDNDAPDGLSSVDTFNLTISADRPTFVNFLNANRTLFINTQWFFQYVKGYEKGFPSNGPFNVLMTLTVDTGYFQDRLLPTVTFVYDFGSSSGAILPQLQYRYTENLSVTFGLAGFWGRAEPADPPLAPIGDPPYRTGRHSDKDFVENALSPVRDRDEVFLRVRYTF
jgi:hypothetical protein